jgi:amino acid adenylation domain-containing protein
MRTVPVAPQDGTSSPGPGSLPISQQRIWVLERLHPRNPAHNVACAFRIRGPLDAEKLGVAWREVVQPHEILRTEFHAVEGVPQPVVIQSSPPLSAGDLGDVSPEQREARLGNLIQEEAQRPFDLSSGPLLRASLWRVAPSEHVFLLVAHRIVCDEASLRVLERQLVLRYGTGQSGQTRATVQMPMQYSEYESRRGAVSEEQISYWKQQLAGAPSSLDLPNDRPRPPEQTFRGAAQVFSIEKSMLEQLRSLGENHGATLFMTLLAAFKVLLSRYSRQDDLVVGTAICGRGDPKLENLVGPMENMVAIRTDLSGAPTFSELLTRIRDVTEKAFSHQDVPFEALLEQLPLERDLTRNPLFQVAFTQRVASEPILAADLHWEGVRVDTETEFLDLTVNVVERNRQVEARFCYSTDLFEHATIARMVGHFRTLLQSALETPGQAVSLLPLLTAAERDQILVEWNDSAVKYPGIECVHELVEAQVRRTPDAVAVTCNNQSLTYAELNQRANQLAHYLVASGVQTGSLVAIYMDRSLDMLLAVLATLKSGAAYVPLDPMYPRDRLAFMLSDSSPAVLLTQQKMLDQLPPDVANAICIDSAWDDIAKQSAENVQSGATRKNLAYVIYTSGSTGKPKGVCLPHRALTNLIFWQWDNSHLPQSSRTIQFTSLSFDVSFQEIFSTWCSGGTLVVVSEALRRDPISLLRFLREENIARLFLPFVALQHLAEIAQEEKDLPNLFEIITAGEQLRVTRHLAALFRRMPQCKLYNHYGPSESHVVTSFRMTGVPDTWPSLPPIGKPIANTQIYILDPFLNPVPVGVSGELYIGGISLANGYLNRPELTAERFTPDPFARTPGSRLYKTGDVARMLPDGNIECLGRSDHQVKIRGFRIELGEVETALTQHSAVRQAAVAVREDIPGDKRLVAYLVSNADDLDIRELRGYLARFLPEYMVPSGFSILPALPLTPSGKVDRKALPAPLPDHTHRSDVIAPRNQLETQLVSIFQKVLNADSVSIHDDFFDLGGHSLTATRLLSQVKEITGWQIPLSTLFRGATVESLARLIAEQGEASDSVVMEIQAGDRSRLPFFAIVPPGEESLGYAMLSRHMGSGQTVYKIQGHAPIVGTERPYSKQELHALTEEYVAAMRTVQPHGPYCLGGLCDGTHIAEQIVLRLEAQGEEVGLFAIFDTWVMQHSQIRWLWKVDYYRQRLRQMKAMNLTDRLASYRRVAQNKADNLLGKKAPRTDWQETYWPENFTPARFRAPVVLFKRPKQQFYYINDPQMGWGARSLSGVEIHEVEFHHLEILREPHVRQFAEMLAKCMARVSQRSVLRAAPAENQQASLTVSVQQVRQGS